MKMQNPRGKKSIETGEKKPYKSFHEISRLPGPEMQSLLQQISISELSLALTGASPKEKNSFFKNLSEHAANQIREDMACQGAVRKADVDNMRKRIVDIANGACPAQANDAPHAMVVDPELSVATPVEDKARSLCAQPLNRLTSAEVATIMTGLAMLAKRQGILPLEAVAESVDDAFLKGGLGLIIDGVPPESVREVLETRKQAALEEYERRLSIIITGLLAMQKGESPRWVEMKCQAFLPPEPKS